MNMFKECPNFRVIPSCATCRYVFTRSEYDDADTYFCNIDKSKRPICGSVLMDEGFLLNTHSRDESNRQRQEWDDWAKRA